MSKILPLLLALPFVAACSSASEFMKPSGPGTPPGDNEALVIFCRPSRMVGSAVVFDIWDRERLLGFAEKGSNFEYRCAPGKHFFVARAENGGAIDAELAAGWTYYVWVTPRMGVFAAAVGFTPVTRGSELEQKVSKELLKSNCRELIPELAAPYEAGNREAVRKLIEEFEKERKEDILRLGPEDGRSREASDATRLKEVEPLVEP